MANRRFQDVQALQREVKILTGVVGNDVTSLPLGIDSCTRVDATTLKVVLKDKYEDLVGVSLIQKVAGGSFSHVDATAFNSNNEVVFTVNDVTTTCEFYLTLFLKNTSVPN